MVNRSFGDEEENCDIPKGGRDAFFYVYAYLIGKFLDNICANTAQNKLDLLNLTKTNSGGVSDFHNLW